MGGAPVPGAVDTVPMRDDPQPSGAHPVLRGLEPGALKRIDESSERLLAEPGAFLLRAGESATHIYLIHHGQVSLEQQDAEASRREFAIMGSGDLLACPSLCENRPWPFSARAVGWVVAQALPVRALMRVGEADPELAWELSRRLISALSRQLDAARWKYAEASRVALASQELALKSLCGELSGGKAGPVH